MPDDYKTAAAYVRVSTEDQVELSPASQLTEIRKWAAAHAYSVPDQYVFVDEGISGKKIAGRDAFRRLIGTAKLKPKPFNAILLWKFSRFARNRDDAVFYKSVLRKQLHIEVISISEPIADGKLGILMEALIEAMDEYYSINLAEEVKRGMEEKHRRGEFQTCPAFGYRVQGNILVPFEPEASCVREIFRRFVSGAGYTPIAKWLNASGIATRRGNPFENRSVEYILRNPVYIGKLRWNPAGRSDRNFSDPDIVLTDAKHEPLIGIKIWDSAQERITALKALKKHSRCAVSSGKDWISGLIRCSTCGGTMIFSKPHYWKCNNYARGRCPTAQHISSNLLKEAVMSRLQSDMQADLPITCQIVQCADCGEDPLSLLYVQRESLVKRLGRLREAYLAGADTLEEYQASRESIRSCIQDLERQIAEAKKGSAECGAPEEIQSEIQIAVKTLFPAHATVDQLRQASHQVIDYAVWDKAKNLLQIHYRSVF